MRDRSAANLYGLLFGLLRFMQSAPAGETRLQFLNPDISSNGWESRATVLAILCRDMPFSTASIRGELNQRNLGIHCLASCNLKVERSESGELRRLLAPGDDATGASHESLIYFEITRHSNLGDLSELEATLRSILSEVSVVVDDFEAMRERLDAAKAGLPLPAV
jgi:glutamate dehydrogenase